MADSISSLLRRVERIEQTTDPPQKEPKTITINFVDTAGNVVGTKIIVVGQPSQSFAERPEQAAADDK